MSRGWWRTHILPPEAIRDWWDTHVLPLPDRPSALTWEQWQDHHARMRKEFPFRNFLHWTLPIFIARTKRRCFTEPYWALQHRFNPKHRYNILRTGLKPGYYDPCTRFLHAIMEEVCTYVAETEETVDRTYSPEKWAPLLAAAEWWPRYKAWLADNTQWDFEKEQQWETEADNHLVAIMRVRQGIWYP